MTHKKVPENKGLEQTRLLSKAELLTPKTVEARAFLNLLSIRLYFKGYPTVTALRRNPVQPSAYSYISAHDDRYSPHGNLALDSRVGRVGDPLKGGGRPPGLRGNRARDVVG